ncbi:galactose-binding lectin l-1-like [Physella acuta]|uniref:galactose-binding lectin l-1-like n=1 Tax=Physella acuta TaxID=109671 RepID=UPI0027DB644F|nr:galactose-binding lectin l-1-like [Physella acuta]
MEDIRFVTITGEVNITKVDYYITRPKVPMNVYVYGIYQTDWIFIKGISAENSRRFIVTLVCGQEYETNDNAFSMDVRYDFESSQRKILFSYKSGGFWSDATEITAFPFTIDTDFDLGIKVELETFKVYVGGVYLTETDHTIEGADYLDIRGDVNVSKITFK